jgi:CopG family transcriptional regulator / antitoxin EndoAI
MTEVKIPRKVLVALPPAMLIEIDQVATAEHRTRSDLIREALRSYIYAFQVKQRGLTTLNQELVLTPNGSAC